MKTEKLRYSIYGCNPQDEYGHATIEYSKGDYNHPTFLEEVDSTWEASLSTGSNYKGMLTYLYDNKRKKVITSTFGLNIMNGNKSI